jgi:hypothetical protein
VAGGAFEGRDFVATLGHYCGTFAADWLGIPATGRRSFLRYGEVHAVEGGGSSRAPASGTCST